MYTILKKKEKSNNIFNKNPSKYFKLCKKDKNYVNELYECTFNPKDTKLLNLIDKEKINNSKNKDFIKKIIFYILLNNYYYSDVDEYIHYIIKNYELFKDCLSQKAYAIDGGKKKVLGLLSNIDSFISIFLITKVVFDTESVYQAYDCIRYRRVMYMDKYPLSSKVLRICNETKHFTYGSNSDDKLIEMFPEQYVKYFFNLYGLKEWYLNAKKLDYRILFYFLHRNNYIMYKVSVYRSSLSENYVSAYNLLFYRKQVFNTLKELTVIKIIEEFVFVPDYYPMPLLNINLRK